VKSGDDMKKFLILFAFIFSTIFAISPDEALSILKKSTKQYISREEISKIKPKKVIATILSCSDQSVKVENIFNIKGNNLYNVTVLGNIALEPEIASIEYSVTQLESPLILVMGHHNCAIIRDTLKGEVRNVKNSTILNALESSLSKAKIAYGGNFSEMLYKQSVIINIYNSMENIIKGSEIIRQLIELNKLKVVGVLLNENSKTLEWLGEHPMQKEIMAGNYDSNELISFLKTSNNRQDVTSEKADITSTNETKNLKQNNLNLKTVSEKKSIKSIEKPLSTELKFFMDKTIASPRNPSYITIRIESPENVFRVSIKFFAQSLKSKRKELIFALPELKVINGVAQTQFYFSGRKFKKNLFLPKGNYKIIGEVKCYNSSGKMVERKIFESSNIILLN
jgi:carbonic anhydrase